MIFYEDKVIDFCRLTDTLGDFFPVAAAGGVVRNAEGRYLMISRNGRWELPKGHIDPGESAVQAALREVSEECGITGVQLLGGSWITMHSYINRKGRRELKTTYWFLMSYEGSEELVPQTGEGITNIGWFGGEELKHNIRNSHRNIRALLERMLKIS